MSIKSNEIFSFVTFFRDEMGKINRLNNLFEKDPNREIVTNYLKAQYIEIGKGKIDFDKLVMRKIKITDLDLSYKLDDEQDRKEVIYKEVYFVDGLLDELRKVYKSDKDIMDNLLSIDEVGIVNYIFPIQNVFCNYTSTKSVMIVLEDFVDFILSNLVCFYDEHNNLIKFDCDEKTKALKISYLLNTQNELVAGQCRHLFNNCSEYNSGINCIYRNNYGILDVKNIISFASILSYIKKKADFINTTNTDHDLYKVFKVLYYGFITSFNEELSYIVSDEKVKELNLSKEEYNLDGLLKETFDIIMYLVENYDDLASKTSGNLDMLLYSKYEFELATLARKYNRTIKRVLDYYMEETVQTAQ